MHIGLANIEEEELALPTATMANDNGAPSERFEPDLDTPNGTPSHFQFRSRPQTAECTVT